MKPPPDDDYPHPLRTAYYHFHQPEFAARHSARGGLATAYRIALDVAGEFARDGFQDHALGAAHVADDIRRELHHSTTTMEDDTP